jgi:integrase
VRYLSPVLKWAGKRALVPKGMVLEPPTDLTPVKRRVLKEDELRALLPHLTGPHGEACLFMLLTATRLEEVTGAVWSEFDLEAGLWTIPGRRRKDTRGAGKRRVAPAVDHTIPLTPQALAILHARKEEREAYEAEIGEKLPHDFVFSGKRWAGALGNWHRELQPIHEASGVLDWSAHSMRRTCATLAGNLGVPPHVTAVMLGRKNLMVEQAGGGVISSDLETGYNQARYSREHRAALIQVSNFISKIVT